MSVSGQRIHRRRDDFGWVEVWQDGDLRYLSFDGETAQSGMNVHEPARLVYDYTRAMVLALLFVPRPREVLLLGLGAGSLASALHSGFDTLRIRAVELRPLVVDIAKEWFFLPGDRRLTTQVGDAGEYLLHASRSVDVIFADLYQPQGMDEQQVQTRFLAACRSALHPAGILVVNYWQASNLTSLALNQTLGEVFGRDFLSLTVPGGNCIVLAFDGGLPEVPQSRLIETARGLGRRLDVPLTRLARDLHRQNRLRLRYRI